MDTKINMTIKVSLSTCIDEDSTPWYSSSFLELKNKKTNPMNIIAADMPLKKVI